jgi:hypothetical protein
MYAAYELPELEEEVEEVEEEEPGGVWMAFTVPMLETY